MKVECHAAPLTTILSVLTALKHYKRPSIQIIAQWTLRYLNPTLTHDSMHVNRLRNLRLDAPERGGASIPDFSSQDVPYLFKWLYVRPLRPGPVIT